VKISFICFLVLMLLSQEILRASETSTTTTNPLCGSGRVISSQGLGGGEIVQQGQVVQRVAKKFTMQELVEYILYYSGYPALTVGGAPVALRLQAPVGAVMVRGNDVLQEISSIVLEFVNMSEDRREVINKELREIQRRQQPRLSGIEVAQNCCYIGLGCLGLSGSVLCSCIICDFSCEDDIPHILGSGPGATRIKECCVCCCNCISCMAGCDREQGGSAAQNLESRHKRQQGCKMLACMVSAISACAWLLERSNGSACEQNSGDCDKKLL
jgi:hypothetical protein